MVAFTIPYFSLADQPPAADSAPLSPSGIFGINATSGKFVREEKFSFSWSGGPGANGPFLMIALNLQYQYEDDRTEECPNGDWISNNLFHILNEWEEVLDLLDEQTTLPLFSASSVAEGRLASEQNGNIRLLTMVTIAYLPLTLATSIYSMDALPKSAGLVSYVVVTIFMCAITYILVVNLRHLKNAIFWGRGSVRNMVRTRGSGKNTSALKPASSIA
ncbi:MAG: hypothetical protein Q9181_002275 [Wetmoreana brouardii]